MYDIKELTQYQIDLLHSARNKTFCTLCIFGLDGIRQQIEKAGLTGYITTTTTFNNFTTLILTQKGVELMKKILEDKKIKAQKVKKIEEKKSEEIEKEIILRIEKTIKNGTFNNIFDQLSIINNNCTTKICLSGKNKKYYEDEINRNLNELGIQDIIWFEIIEVQKDLYLQTMFKNKGRKYYRLCVKKIEENSTFSNRIKRYFRRLFDKKEENPFYHFEKNTLVN